MMNINQSNDSNNLNIESNTNHTQISRTGELVIGVIVSIFVMIFI
jgi:hypothetical protein